MGLSDFTFTFHFQALEKEMATHSSVLAWRIPGMGKPGGLPSVGSHRVGHDWSDLAAAAAAEKPATPPYQLLGPQQEGWVRRALATWTTQDSIPRQTGPTSEPELNLVPQPGSGQAAFQIEQTGPDWGCSQGKERHPAQACQDRILNVQKRAPQHFCAGIT